MIEAPKLIAIRKLNDNQYVASVTDEIEGAEHDFTFTYETAHWIPRLIWDDRFSREMGSMSPSGSRIIQAVAAFREGCIAV